MTKNFAQTYRYFVLNYVLIFDSGNGGKYVYEQFIKKNSNQNLILFMDKNFCPYGNKSKKMLKEHITLLFEKLFKKYNISLIIIACNTISSMFKEYLKRHFVDKIFLFVEPKLNKKILKEKTILLATSNTIKYSKIIKKYQNCQNLICVGFENLAKIIDDNINNLDKILPFLRQNLQKYTTFNPKNIVLGCTHYSLITAQLKKLFGDVNFFDNSKKQIENAIKILDKQKFDAKTPRYLMIDNI